jgi:hypothetical protein
MRVLLLVLLTAPVLPAWQSASQTYVFDAEGRRTAWSGATTGEKQSLTLGRDMNGRQVKVEEVEEKVVRDRDGVRVVERVVRRYDPNGRPLPPEKEVIETTQRPGGGATTAVTQFRADLNGRLQPAERIVSDTHDANGATRTETRVERLTINGAFAPIERRVAVETVRGDDAEREESSYLPDANGRFQQATRRVARTIRENGATREQTDEYEAATTGQLQLSRQTVARVERDAQGAERRVVDVYGPAATGRPVTPGELALRERQVIEVRPTPSGAVETYSIQRPAPDGRGQLGPLVKIAETVCTGKCLPETPSAAKPTAPGEVEQ